MIAAIKKSQNKGLNSNVPVHACMCVCASVYIHVCACVCPILDWALGRKSSMRKWHLNGSVGKGFHLREKQT